MITLLVALAIQNSTQPQASPIEAFPALKAKISMDSSMLPLREFAKAIQKETGVHLTVSNELLDRKVGAFFTQRPASEVMHRLETTLFVRWEPTADGLRLVLPAEVRAQEKLQLDAERTAVKDTQIKLLKAWVEASRDPYDVAKARVTA